MRVLVGLLVAALSATLLAQHSARPRVYFGEVSAEGEAVSPPTKELAESYKDLREEAATHPDVGRVFDVTDSLRGADVIVSIVDRRVRVTGVDRTRRESFASGGTENELTARLSVPRLHTRKTLDGSEGAKKGLSFKQLAGNIVKQTAEWVTANQERLKEGLISR
jgi:hypothetical protein